MKKKTILTLLLILILVSGFSTNTKTYAEDQLPRPTDTTNPLKVSI